MTATKQNCRVYCVDTGVTEGDVDLCWMAINPGQRNTSNVNNIRIRIGCLSPTYFHKSMDHGDSQAWNVILPDNLYKSLDAVVATPNNELVCCGTHVPAVVAVHEKKTLSSFVLNSRNSDGTDGICNFYWAALGTRITDIQEKDLINRTERDLLIEGDDTIDIDFPDGIPLDSVSPGEKGGGDWALRDIVFKTDFPEPPVVFVTPKPSPLHPAEVPKRAAVVGIVTHRTRFGFRLEMRNSGCNEGRIDFNWVAFGYADRASRA